MAHASTTSIKHTLTQEITALRTLQPLIAKSIGKAVDCIAKHKGKIVISGMGKSGHIGQTIAATFSSLGIPASFVHPVEALHGDLGIIADSDILIAISSSGETKELLRVVHFAKSKKNAVIAITCTTHSALAKAADLPIIFSLKSEGSPHDMAPMASSTATLVIGHMIASGVAANRNFQPIEFAALHPGGSLGLKLQNIKDIMRPLTDFSAVKINSPSADVFQAMTDKRTAGITAVIDGKRKLVGVIADGDIRRALLKKTFDAKTTAKDLMTTNPKVLGPNNTAYDAVALLEKNKITSLFVVDTKGILRGLVHIHDIVERQLV